MFTHMLLKIENTFYLSSNLDKKMSKMTTLRFLNQSFTGIIIKKLLVCLTVSLCLFSVYLCMQCLIQLIF